jgi:chorismate mutase
MRGHRPRIFDSSEVKTMPVRGVRGAIDVSDDRSESILAATQDLLLAILEENPTLRSEDLASGIFTTTEDLNAAYPAQAAREMGWNAVPMICSREIPVPGGLARCIRVLLQWNTDLPQHAIHHIYLGAAASLRPDLSVTEISK